MEMENHKRMHKQGLISSLHQFSFRVQFEGPPILKLNITNIYLFNGDSSFEQKLWRNNILARDAFSMCSTFDLTG